MVYIYTHVYIYRDMATDIDIDGKGRGSLFVARLLIRVFLQREPKSPGILKDGSWRCGPTTLLFHSVRKQRFKGGSFQVPPQSDRRQLQDLWSLIGAWNP